jgi:FkbM family methyltransferase
MPPTISYAQNGEDIRLNRAFPAPHRGFYIEVGAYDPVDLSITKLFYDRGWRGISVEPSPTQHAKMTAARPDDRILNLALSDHEGRMTFHESVGVGLSTLQKEDADRFARDGFERKSYDVAVRTLTSVCEEYVRGPIDFLTVDVEGHEEAVLRGADFSRFRPKVAVVEATEPRSTKPSHDGWEPLLLAADYEYVTFDGVSRFYVAKEHRDLAAALATPPSALDEYIPYGQAKAEQELSRLRNSPLTAPSILLDRILRSAKRRILSRTRLREFFSR